MADLSSPPPSRRKNVLLFVVGVGAVLVLLFNVAFIVSNWHLTTVLLGETEKKYERLLQNVQERYARHTAPETLPPNPKEIAEEAKKGIAETVNRAVEKAVAEAKENLSGNLISQLPAQVHYATLDFDSLLASSTPGKAITKYIGDYAKLMDDGIEKIEKAATAALSNKDYGLFLSLQKDRAYLLEQKKKAADSAKDYLRSIIRDSLRDFPDSLNVIVVDGKGAYGGNITDVTAQIVNRLKDVVPKMPALPKVVVQELSQEKQRKKQPLQNSSDSKASKNSKNKGAKRK